MTKGNRASVLFAATIFVLLAVSGTASATTLTENPALSQEGPGLTIAQSGVGLLGLGAGTELICVDIGGPVANARLYWAGRTNRQSPPYEDTELLFDGNLVTGDIIGSETQAPPNNINNIGFAQDVTTIVQASYTGPGNYCFAIQDGDLADALPQLNGAAILVIFQDESDMTPYRVIVFEGLDFAYGVDGQTPAAQVTEPVQFNHGATGSDRMAELVIFAGDATPQRPDRIDITDTFGGVTQLFDQLVGADGPSWDALEVAISIPAGGGTTTVQLFSAPPDQLPDSLLWELGALRLPLDAPVCGDGNVDTDLGETCDPPGSFPDPMYPDNACRDDCTYCGDGIVDMGEECDPADPTGPPCNADCTLEAFCGDGNVDTDLGETCDPPGSFPDPMYPDNACRDDCTYCGDGFVDMGEECDPAAPDAPANCTSTCELEEGGEGCTPGYWKQPQHLGNWVGYAPSDIYATVFGVTPSFGNLTLLQVVGQGGGGENALGRHAVAALLNSANADVSYGFTTAGVIMLVQQAYASGDFEGAKALLEFQNELECPLGRALAMYRDRTTRFRAPGTESRVQPRNSTAPPLNDIGRR